MALLPSPLLGPVVWARVGERLRGRGYDAVELTLPSRLGSPADVVEAFLAALPEDRPVVLVPHSNAGLYVAKLAAHRTVEAVVFVDALLPGAGAWTPTTSPPMRAWLGELADERGLLPPWTGWWPEDDLADLFGDDATRRAVEESQPRVPVSYFDRSVPSPPGWEGLPAAYLAFGDAYADERAEAARRAWPVETLPGRHLHPLVDPSGVTDAVQRLLDGLRENDLPG